MRTKAIYLALICLVCRLANASAEEIAQDATTRAKSGEPSETNGEAATPTKKETDVLWITRFGPMKESLADVQAIVVKDEDASDRCKRAKRKSDKRYLMCSGSILSSIYVLTSASCVHEATHIRHNVQAPLAVLVAPLKISLQVIKVLDYRIHPLHVEDPYSPLHSNHDLAILKLACRMMAENYRRIQLPKLPMSELCFQEECTVGILRKTGRNAVVLFEGTAKHVPMERRRRRSTISPSDVVARHLLRDSAWPKERKLRKLANPPSFDVNFIGNPPFSSLTSANETNAQVAEVAEVAKAATAKANASIGSIFLDESAAQSELLSTWRRDGRDGGSTRSLFVRSSDGLKGCPQTGSPVMVNGTQAAVISVSCDDRQPTAPWKYTDLYENADWISATMKDWNGCWVETPRTSKIDRDENAPGGPGGLGGPGGPGGAGIGGAGTGVGGGSMCSTCVFNFFLDNCAGGNCSTADASPSAGASLVSLGVPPPSAGKCSESSENLRIDLGPVVRVQKNKESVAPAVNYTDIRDHPHRQGASDTIRREITEAPPTIGPIEPNPAARATESNRTADDQTVRTHGPEKREFYAEDSRPRPKNIGRTDTRQTVRPLDYYDGEKINSLPSKSQSQSQSQSKSSGTPSGKSEASKKFNATRSSKTHDATAGGFWMLSPNGYKIYDLPANPHISSVTKYRVNEIEYGRRAAGVGPIDASAGNGALPSMKFLQFPWKRSSPSYARSLLSPDVMSSRTIRWSPYNATAVLPALSQRQSPPSPPPPPEESRQTYPTIDRLLRDNRRKSVEETFFQASSAPRGTTSSRRVAANPI